MGDVCARCLGGVWEASEAALVPTMYIVVSRKTEAHIAMLSWRGAEGANMTPPPAAAHPVCGDLASVRPRRARALALSLRRKPPRPPPSVDLP